VFCIFLDVDDFEAVLWIEQSLRSFRGEAATYGADNFPCCVERKAILAPERDVAFARIDADFHLGRVLDAGFDFAILADEDCDAIFWYLEFVDELIRTA